MNTEPTRDDICTLCNRPLSEPSRADWTTDVYSSVCERCASYRMTFQAYHSPLPPPDGNFWLGAAARQHWEITRNPLLITLENMQQLAEEHRSTSVAQNVTKLLNYLVRKSSRPGAWVQISSRNDDTIIDARDGEELMFYVRYLCETSLITAPALEPYASTVNPPKCGCQLTYQGWDYALGTSATSAEHGRVFVAMWFHPSTDSAYKDGISPALWDAGYEPVCMNDRFQNDDINFAILAELRRAQFLVADITGARGGVYFEAGFAKALGRDVFFTCREDRFQDDKHFDTEHFQHTLWKDPADLRSKLREKVLALKGRGPHPTQQHLDYLR